MSTRATIHFQQNGEDRAIIYRHSDGYPAGLGVDLETFLDDLAYIGDNRYDDAEYLAVKYVVWQTHLYSLSSAVIERPPLSVIGIGIVMQDPEDIKFRYIVDCHRPRPIINVQAVGHIV